jgi:hypothetical protein
VEVVPGLTVVGVDDVGVGEDWTVVEVHVDVAVVEVHVDVAEVEVDETVTVVDETPLVEAVPVPEPVPEPEPGLTPVEYTVRSQWPPHVSLASPVHAMSQLDAVVRVAFNALSQKHCGCIDQLGTQKDGASERTCSPYSVPEYA